MEKIYDVTALGELLIDFTENGISAQGNPLLEANPGGAPCNVLAMLEKLGKKTAFIGKVGKDMFGEQLKTAVEEVGIDTRNLVMDEEVHTTLAFVHTYPDGDRDFSFYRNPGADMMLKKEEVDEELIRSAKIFHFGTLSSTHEGVREATRYAIDVAKEAGCIVVLNAAPAIELPEECLSKVDILVVNEVEAEFYCHEKIDSVEKAKTEIKKMAEKYNITDYRGSVYVFEDNAFTGKVIPMWDSVSKNKAIDELVEKHNLDLEKSYAYGDTNGDINMLRRVGNPIAINPTKELLLHINQDDTLSKTTKIIVERKDTIYSLAPDVEIYKNDL